MDANRITDSVIEEHLPTRAIPGSLASTLGELAHEQPVLVTSRDLEDVLLRHNVQTPVGLVAHRLRQAGWLLTTAVLGVWEFAPGAHAGAIGHGDPLIDIRAVLAADPALDLAITGASALVMRSLIERAPDKPHVAVGGNAKIPAGLRRAAIVTRFSSQLHPIALARVAVHSVESVLVLAATSPRHMQNWAAIGERLDDITAAIDQAKLETELTDRPSATRARLAYLLCGVAPSLAEQISPPTTRPPSIVWFGPRGPGRLNSRFGVVDTLLPFHPGDASR